MREDESGGVGGACGEQAVDKVGGVAGVSRGERGKTDAREGERAGESRVGELVDIAGKASERDKLRDC